MEMISSIVKTPERFYKLKQPHSWNRRIAYYVKIECCYIHDWRL